MTVLILRLVTVLSALLCHVLAAPYSNPIARGTVYDPFITFSEGYYYFLSTGYDLRVTRARTLDGLKTGQTKVIFPDSGVVFETPKLHKIDGTWWLYFTAPNPDPSGNPPVTIFVLKGGPTPRDPFTYAAQLINATAASHPTILRLPNSPTPHLLFACPRILSLPSLCITPLLSPTTPGPIAILASANATWERRQTGGFFLPTSLTSPSVLANPATNQTFITYSTGNSPELSSNPITLLTHNGGNPVDERSWVKTGPYHLGAYTTSAGSDGTVCGGGMVKFFTSPDGKEVWSVYLAGEDESDKCGRGGDWHLGVKRVRFGEEGGMPEFGGTAERGEWFPGPGGE
ncbi:hypothetical protein OQA88_8383 [Cercophora sp. LCS_1]